MFDREIQVYDFLKGYALRLVEDIEDARFAEQPSPGVNPPAWLLGHLAVVAEMGAGLLGASASLPDESWNADFGPGSTPRGDRASYPSKAALVAAYEAGHDHLVGAARAADPGRLDRRHPIRIEGLRRHFPTIGGLVTHLMTSHEAGHLGHLSNWRRQVGMPYLF